MVNPNGYVVYDGPSMLDGGEPAMNVFATGAWRLLIASTTITMPGVEDDAAIASVNRWHGSR